MNRVLHRSLILAFAWALAAQAFAVPGEGSERSVSVEGPEPQKIVSSEPGEITYETNNLVADEQKQNGVRAARVVRRAELPGGPWANGEIGDYILENAHICVIVKGEDRGDAETPLTGTVADIALREQMWDLLGNVSQIVSVDGKPALVRYGRIEIRPAPNEKTDPFLMAYGALVGIDDMQVATMLSLEQNEPRLNIETRLVSAREQEVQIDMAERVEWGAMPIFVGGHGTPHYAQPQRGLKAHWLCGFLDDFCLGVSAPASDPIDIVQTQGNTTLLRYGNMVKGDRKVVSMQRSFLASRGDMAPVSEFALRIKKAPYGYIQGLLTQESDERPVPGARVEIRTLTPLNLPPETPAPYAVTQTDREGRYRIAVAAGDYAMRSQTPGRPLYPIYRPILTVPAGGTLQYDAKQRDQQYFEFEVVDAETQKPMPAKVRFEVVGSDENLRDSAFSLGPPWSATGARQVYYLRPGPNKIPIVGGRFKCTFSRGPEYDIVTKEVDLDPQKPEKVTAALRHAVPTPGMVSVALDVTTDKSPTSRVSAEDLVRAAAGEGLEWIVSGDLGSVTNLNDAIRIQGVAQWIKASGGVHLSYQHKKLFGEFYIFPVPLDTPQPTLDALAGPETSPAQFFEAVRKAFPDAIVAALEPTYANSSYLSYYNVDTMVHQMPTSPDCSLDFDAIEVFGTRDGRVRRTGIDLMELLLYAGHYKMPLAVSRTPSLFYDEPGYPRTYLVAGQDAAKQLSDKDLAKALRDGMYFITTGPIIEQKVNDKWPTTHLTPPHGELTRQVRVLCAPWVEIAGVFPRGRGLPFSRVSIAPGARPEDLPEPIRYPLKAEEDKPEQLYLYSVDKETKQLKYRDACYYLEVEGPSTTAVTTERGGVSPASFAFTPPVFLDGQGDGKYEIK